MLEAWPMQLLAALFPGSGASSTGSDVAGHESVCVRARVCYSHLLAFFFLNNIGFCSRQVRNANMSGCPQHLIITVPIWKKEAATESKLH